MTKLNEICQLSSSKNRDERAVFFLPISSYFSVVIFHQEDDDIEIF